MCVFFAPNTLMIKKMHTFSYFPCMFGEYEPYDFSNQNCILPICIDEIFYNILNNGISLKFHQNIKCFLALHAWLGLL
jgi:hypothetical protein